MKRSIILTLLISLFIFSHTFSQSSISMGPGYENDIYFSVDHGVVEIVDRTSWDLGFFTSPWSAGISTNGGAGVELKLYPKGDTASWMAIDTNGMSGWPVLYNGEDYWENGAFNRNSGNHPDYGWGVYNTQSHDVIGDSLYVIKLQDGSYKKLWIVSKVSVQNKYIFRYADLDNSNEVEKVLENTSYSDVNFSYFSFGDGSFSNREPVKDSWDILFTKYLAMQPQGVPYPVVGVLNNIPVKANRFHPVTTDYTDWDALELDSLKAVVGFNWKYFDMGTLTWILEDSLVFFISPGDDRVYRMYFTEYGGTSTGDISFVLEEVDGLSVDEFETMDFDLRLSPNPASNEVKLTWDQAEAGQLNILIFSLEGRKMLEKKIQSAGMVKNQHKLDISGLTPGVYLVSVFLGKQTANKKLVIE